MDQVRVNAKNLIEAVAAGKLEITETRKQALQIAQHMVNGGSYTGRERTLVFVSLRPLREI